MSDAIIVNNMNNVTDLRCVFFRLSKPNTVDDLLYYRIYQIIELAPEHVYERCNEDYYDDPKYRQQYVPYSTHNRDIVQLFYHDEYIYGTPKDD